MKKIMFNDRFGLTDAVLGLKKTMTRRIIRGIEDNDEISEWSIDDYGKAYISIYRNGRHMTDIFPSYNFGEEVAVAQRYADIIWRDNTYIDHVPDLSFSGELCYSKGWRNKMFVKASLMPHRIRITNIKLERLCNISDEDCLREGIINVEWKQWLEQDINDFSPQKYKTWDVFTLPMYWDEGSEDIIDDKEAWMAKSSQTAFKVLIMKMMGKKVLESNPWVFAYEFELIK